MNFLAFVLVTSMSAGLVSMEPGTGTQPPRALAAANLSASSANVAKPLPEPYPLTTCAVSGKKLGSMGSPIVKSYEGREVRFCCKSCPPKFEADVPAGMAKLDEAIIADQLPLYPIDTSVVSSKKLPEKPVDWVFNNRLIRLGDESEKAEFQKDPAKYIAALDKAVIEKQSKDYPLKKCPVMNDALDSRTGSQDVVLAGRLIRVCCDPCVLMMRNDPSKYIAIVDEARKANANK